jgi:hypothetical protein
MERKNYSISKLIKTMPDASALFFRDGMPPAKSLDYVMMALILENWHQEIRRLDIFKNASGGPVCLLADRQGAHYHPVTGDAARTDGLTPRESLKKSTVRSYIRKGFYIFRKNIMLDAYGDSTIKVRNIMIFSEGLSVKENLSALNDTVRWKLSGPDDISDNFEDHINLKSLSAGGNENRGRYDAICPVDGYIKTVAGELKSPRWTWRALCGRQYKIILCPHCLGAFYVLLASMS